MVKTHSALSMQKKEDCYILVRRKEHKRYTYLKMVVGKSFVSANSIDGSLEWGKWTWREGVKLRSKRLEKKKMLWINTKEISYIYISKIKWIKMSSLNGLKWTELTKQRWMEWSGPNGQK